MSVASTSTPTSTADSWGGPVATTSSHTYISNKPAKTVRDDWDDEDDEDAQDDAEDPQRLWEEANKRAPMPQVVIASSSTSAAAALSPPPAALQPVLRILKRPSATTSPSASSLRSASSSGTSSPGPSAGSPPPTGGPQTYAEREAAYHAARERIFGDAAAIGTADGDAPPASGARGAQTSAVAATVPIAREPKGPPVAKQSGQKPPSGREQGGESRGFASRRGKRRGAGKRFAACQSPPFPHIVSAIKRRERL